MSTAERSDPGQKRVTPGVTERHTKGCAVRRRARAACTCTPGYMARIRVGERGHQRSVSRTFSSLAEAVSWVAEAKRLARAGDHPVPRQAVPLLREATPAFLARARAGKALNRSGRPYAVTTITNYETVLRLHVYTFVSERYGVALDALPADAIDTRLMQAMVNHLTSAASPAVARQADAALSAVLRDLYAREVIDAVPNRPSLPAPPPRRDKHLTIEQADRLLEHALADDDATGRSLMAPAIAVLIATGCRVTELLHLVWGSDGIDLDANAITISRETTKTDAGARTVGIEREYAAILRRHRMATGRPDVGSLVFTDERGVPLGRGGRLRSGLTRVAKAAGIDGASFHVLRHSQGSWLSAAGESATDIAARLGHRDPSFTLRTYVHPDRDRLAAAPTALAAFRERQRHTQET